MNTEYKMAVEPKEEGFVVTCKGLIFWGGIYPTRERAERVRKSLGELDKASFDANFEKDVTRRTKIA